MRATRSASPGSGSGTRWPRRPEAAGLPHGAMNALCLPPALEFNRALVPDAIARFGEAIGGNAVERTRELALQGGFVRLRDFLIPADDLPALAAATAPRAGNQANPRPA